MTNKAKLYSKLAKAQENAGKLEKDGKNTFSKYTYVTEHQVIAKAKRAILEAGLVSYASVDYVTHDWAQEQKPFMVNVTLTVADPETGEELAVLMPGNAHDKNGDKSIYKAATGAKKYAYMQLLCLSTGDDPEKQQEPYHQPASSFPKPVSQAQAANGAFGGQGTVYNAPQGNVETFMLPSVENMDIKTPHTRAQILERLGRATAHLQEKLGMVSAAEYALKTTNYDWFSPAANFDLHTAPLEELGDVAETLIYTLSQEKA
jgi:hypothetical protein